jgi:ornithine carbamoyltransferase
MQSLLQPIDHSRLDDPSAEDLSAVLANARVLERALDGGWGMQVLYGKHFGLFCESDQTDEACRFRRAAESLGARVAHVRPSLTEESESHALSGTARVLGRLYDAVECQGIPPRLVRRLGGDAGVPFFDGIARADHPTASLAGLLCDGPLAEEDHRVRVVQAVLVGSMGTRQ